MANHPENGDLPAYPSTNVEEYLADLTMQAGATYDDDGDGNHPQNGDLPEYPTTNVEEYLAYLVQAGLGKVTSGYYYNNKFYKDAAHTQEITAKAGSLYYDVSSNTMYVYLNGAFSPVSSSQVGKFLSAWNCATGLPETTPSSVPYTYTTGDYYMATNIATGAYAHNVAMAGDTTSTGIYEGTFEVSLTLSNQVSTAYTTVAALADAIEASVGEGERLEATGLLHPTGDDDVVIHGVLKWVEQGTTYIALLDSSYQKAALVETASTFTDTVSGGLTNYKPNGTTYTGVASTTVETGSVMENDFYFFDGTTWFLLRNSHPEIPAVVQTTGTSTASVMSQDAVTKALVVKTLTSADADYTYGSMTGIALWRLASGLYYLSDVTGFTAAGGYYFEQAKFIQVRQNIYGRTIITGLNADPVSVGNTPVVSCESSMTADGSSYLDYSILPVADTLTSTGTKAPLSANQGKVLKNLIDGLMISGAGAPTTATVGTVGKLYEDTTNGTLYQCTAVDTSTSTYTWEEVGGGPTVVQTTGTSTTDVMSQNAVTSMVFADPSTKRSVQIGLAAEANAIDAVSIGKYSKATGSESTAIGEGANANGSYAIAISSQGCSASGYASIAIGREASASQSASIALGTYSGSNITASGMMDIGSSQTSYGYNSSNYRLLTGLYDPQTAHDAATKGYVDGAIISGGTTAPTEDTVGQVGTLYAYYDTTNNLPILSMCTAVTAQGTTPETYKYTWTRPTVATLTDWTA